MGTGPFVTNWRVAAAVTVFLAGAIAAFVVMPAELTTTIGQLAMIAGALWGANAIGGAVARRWPATLDGPEYRSELRDPRE